MQLNFKTFGATGQPLIILHGLFGMLDNWQTIGKQLAKHFKVYLIDQRNHGKSPRSQDFDYYILADDIEEFMEEHDIADAYLIGHSMGGKVAMQFAVSNPEKVSKLVVVDSAPKDYPPGHDAIFEALFAVKVEHINSRREAAAILESKIEEVAVRQFLLKNLSRSKDGGYQWKFNLPVLFQNYSSITASSVNPYEQFEQPTLFIKGGQSPRYIEVEQDWPIIQHLFPNAQLQIIEDAGHWVHAEQPKAFFDTVMEFLKN